MIEWFMNLGGYSMALFIGGGVCVMVLISILIVSCFSTPREADQGQNPIRNREWPKGEHPTYNGRLPNVKAKKTHKVNPLDLDDDFPCPAGDPKYKDNNGLPTVKAIPMPQVKKPKEHRELMLTTWYTDHANVSDKNIKILTYKVKI